MAPTFATKPTIRQDEDGSTLVFHCAIMADPRPAITWYHNGVKVQDNDKFQVRFFHVLPRFSPVIQFGILTKAIFV
jgi:hypothetical protein